MNSIPDLCYRLAEISETLEPEHYFYFFSMFAFVFICEFIIHLVNFFLQLSFKILDERKKNKSDIK